jgi:hypothetical protein
VDNATWIVVILAVLFVVGVVLLGPRLKRAILKVPGASLDMRTHDRPAERSGGASMEDVKAGGSARNTDRTGQGATMRRVEAQGDAENTVVAETRPKRPKQ